MNLHGIVRAAINTVNPDIPATLRRSIGVKSHPDGRREPAFAEVMGRIQVQGTKSSDLRQIEALDLQGIFRKVYLRGDWQGAVRADIKGGDVFYFPQQQGMKPQKWAVVGVSETFADWCSVIVVLQTEEIEQ